MCIKEITGGCGRRGGRGGAGQGEDVVRPAGVGEEEAELEVPLRNPPGGIVVGHEEEGGSAGGGESHADGARVTAGWTEFCASRAYGLALVDLRLPDGSGLGVVRALRAASPATPCVVITVMGDDANIVTALSAGAQGYLLKDQPRELMIRQLAQVIEGIPALSPPVARRIMDHFRLTGPCEGPEAKLTPRELEVLGLIARGLRIADAACALGLAEGTVASHIKSIYRKLSISSRAEAALHATRMGQLGT